MTPPRPKRRISNYDTELALEMGIPVATLYHQIEFWWRRAKRTDGWIYKGWPDLRKETGLTRQQIRTATDRLVEAGVIAAKPMRANAHNTMHYKQLLFLDGTKIEGVHWLIQPQQGLKQPTRGVKTTNYNRRLSEDYTERVTPVDKSNKPRHWSDPIPGR